MLVPTVPGPPQAAAIDAAMTAQPDTKPLIEKIFPFKRVLRDVCRRPEERK
jgi:hypothetical protein